MIGKLIGLILMGMGFLITKYFPDINRYQRAEMTLAGILIGIFSFLIGIGLLVFG